MSQLGKMARLSQSYSTWPSRLLGSGSCVIFIHSLLLDALTMSPPPPPPQLSCSLSFSVPLFLLSFCLYLSVSPHRSLSPVLALAVCRLTDGSLFAVLSYLSGVGWCVVLLLPAAEQRPVQLRVTPWPEADAAAFELESSWRCCETLYDTWMKSCHRAVRKFWMPQQKSDFLQHLMTQNLLCSETSVFCYAFIKSTTSCCVLLAPPMRTRFHPFVWLLIVVIKKWCNDFDLADGWGVAVEQNHYILVWIWIQEFWKKWSLKLVRDVFWYFCHFLQSNSPILMKKKMTYLSCDRVSIGAIWSRWG